MEVEVEVKVKVKEVEIKQKKSLLLSFFQLTLLASSVNLEVSSVNLEVSDCSLSLCYYIFENEIVRYLSAILIVKRFERD